MAAPLGIFFGRLANFINGELWGKPSTVPWAWVFPDAPVDYSAVKYIEPALGMVNPRHPSQLYEAALEGVLLGTYILWRFWGRAGLFPRRGQIIAEFLVVYAVVRIFGELFREPDADLILGMSRGIFYSIITLLAGVGLWVAALKDKKSGL
jgi:phosphatidylglycerol:prolipoprotein diacylglycerol transferase